MTEVTMVTCGEGYIVRMLAMPLHKGIAGLVNDSWVSHCWHSQEITLLCHSVVSHDFTRQCAYTWDEVDNFYITLFSIHHKIHDQNLL